MLLNRINIPFKLKLDEVYNEGRFFTNRDIANILTNDFFFEKRWVGYVNAELKDSLIYSKEDYQEDPPSVVKIEGIDNYNEKCRNALLKICKFFNWDGHFTTHAFISKAGGMSFKMHVDPATVVIIMLEGKKTYTFDTSFVNNEVPTCDDIELNTNEVLFIPRNYPHMAINTHDSVMVSLGLEHYYTEQMTKVF